MAPDWPLRPLGELTENFDSKRVPVKGTDRKPGPYPYYGASGAVDYVDDFLFDGEYLLIAEDGENLRTRKTPVAFIARDRFWVNNHAHIVRGNDEADTRYLMYALSVADVSGYLSGSTMPKLTQGNMNRIPLPAPPLDEQRRIAHILGTLDDKIELNRRMSETLDEVARALFKSWFVDFDPVRAKAEGRDPGLPKHLADLFPDRLVASELGEIPEGWVVARLADVIENHDRKRVPVSGAERSTMKGRYPYHGAAGVLDYVDDYLFDGVFLLVGEDGSVVTDGGFAVTQYVWGKFWVNNHAHVLTGARHVSTEQLLLYFSFEPVAPYVTGAVQAKLSQGRMASMPFCDAGPKLCTEFARIVAPWFEERRVLDANSAALREARDSLLQELLDGISPSAAKAASNSRLGVAL